MKKTFINLGPGPEVIKLFSCLAKHEICPANKSHIINHSKSFLA